MKLLYGRGVLKDLGVHDPAEYGFDTFQLENLHSGTAFSKITSEVDDMDDWFTEENDFVLSFTPDGDNHMDGGPEVGDIERDPWYDNAGAAFYSDMESLFDQTASEYGSRFKGMRWNHEHKPRQFDGGSKWIAYAQDQAPSDYFEVINSYQSQWTHYLEDIAGRASRDAYANIGEALVSPYNGADYLAVKRGLTSIT